MTGQMTYTKSTKSWKHIPLNKMTARTAQQNYTIQSRNGWYIAWTGELVNHGTLEEMILWVEKTA